MANQGHQLLVSVYLLYILTTSMSMAQAEMGGDIIVTAPHGTYKGRQFSLENGLLNGFFGVRYAKPPVGSLRWKLPERLDLTNETQDATKSAPVCPQLTEFRGEFIGDEDCLFLDIVVGGLSDKQLKPVLVFINSQNFYQSGRSHTGALLAKREDIVVVIINSRLGALGYLYDGPGTGNMGIWDNLSALQWIRHNIESFGGDSSKVTLMGVDSGATIAQLLASTPYSRDRFHQLIIMSPLNVHAPCLHRPMDDRNKLKTLAGCNVDSTVTCDFTTVSAEDIVRNLDNSEPYLMDDILFPNGISVDHIKRYNYMSGVASAEENLLTDVVVKQLTALTNGVITQEVMDTLVTTICSETFKEGGSRCLCVNGISTMFQVDGYAPYPQNEVQEILSSLFHSNHIKNLKEHSRQDNRSTFAYIVDVTEDAALLGLPPSTSGSDKSIMIKLVFGYPYLGYGDKFDFLNTEFYNGSLLSGTPSKVMFGGRVELRPQSQDVMRYWANFVRTGNPSSGWKVDLEWPNYSIYNRAFLTIDDSETVKIRPYFNLQRYYEYFNDFFYKSLECVSDNEAAGNMKCKD